ncbi:hypothetical protein [Aquimarina algiphila]|nr:hypothetical protein [Aquimarina algiphila]
MKMIKRILVVISVVLLTGCSAEDDDLCTERVCPDGFNNCFDKPCEF